MLIGNINKHKNNVEKNKVYIETLLKTTDNLVKKGFDVFKCKKCGDIFYGEDNFSNTSCKCNIFHPEGGNGRKVYTISGTNVKDIEVYKNGRFQSFM